MYMKRDPYTVSVEEIPNSFITETVSDMLVLLNHVNRCKGAIVVTEAYQKNGSLTQFYLPSLVHEM